MTELNLILPCCIGTSCGYSNGLAEGYVLGILTIIMIFVLIEIINTLFDRDVEKTKED
jgi:4-hydroxybenzoate polyprenyltransferase